MDTDTIKFIDNHSYHSAEHQLVFSKHSGVIEIERFKETCLTTIQNIRKFSCKAVLCDNRELPSLPSECQDWIRQTWFPQAIEAGVKRIAFLIPDNQAGKEAMQNANSSSNATPVELKYFDKTEEALKWLKA